MGRAGPPSSCSGPSDRAPGPRVGCPDVISVRSVDEARSLSARIAQHHQIVTQLTGRSLHARERITGNLLLRLARAEARVELAERPVCVVAADWHVPQRPALGTLREGAASRRSL